MDKTNGEGLYRATFIAPHQDQNAGGLYAIQQFAVHLAPFLKVNLVVQEAEPRPLPGVCVQRSSTLSPETVPDADVIALYINAPADNNFLRLPGSKGERILLFQGYTELESETVRARLRLGLRVLATSKWLTEEARRFGSRAAYTPYGLDTAIFFPGTSASKRDPVVSMMCHYLDWKGTEDGIAALNIVRRARPDTDFRLFGVGQPDFPGRFHSRLARTDVGALLRESAIFVCSSWEEGFGMPGLEALACGAALATTDTKGSRDYAIQGSTALVSPPRKPELLAENVLTLLDDLDLRDQLATCGAKYVHTHFLPWPKAAQVMRRALVGGSE